jgi:hypothetical protein
MPAKDRLHDTVKRALVKDGWSITSEQVTLPIEERYLFIDIEAQNRNSGYVILVEVKELSGVSSPVEALALAIGKYFLYRIGLDLLDDVTPVYLAVSEAAFHGILSEALGQIVIQKMGIPLLVFSVETEEIVEWIP